MDAPEWAAPDWDHPYHNYHKSIGSRRSPTDYSKTVGFPKLSEEIKRIVPYDHDVRDPLDQVVKTCMICGSETRSGRRLSQYNKTSTVCVSCGTFESALLVIEPNILQSPKPLFSKWIEAIKALSNQISSHAGIAYVRHGVETFPVPDRDQVIAWLRDQIRLSSDKNGVGYVNEQKRDIKRLIERWSKGIANENAFVDFDSLADRISRSRFDSMNK